MMSKFNTNIEFKSNLRCFEYASIKNLDNNEKGKTKAPLHNTPNNNLFDTYDGKI